MKRWKPLEMISADMLVVQCDPLYNLRRVQVQYNEDYEQLSKSDMSDLIDLLTQVMGLGAHGHTSCSALQFKL